MMSQNEVLKPNNDVKALCDTELANFHLKNRLRSIEASELGMVV